MTQFCSPALGCVRISSLDKWETAYRGNMIRRAFKPSTCSYVSGSILDNSFLAVALCDSPVLGVTLSESCGKSWTIFYAIELSTMQECFSYLVLRMGSSSMS